jgi:hypothetical protein
LGQAGPDFGHDITVEYGVDAVTLKVAQHVGIASTAGFDIALRIDVQAAPWGRTIEIGHAVFTTGSLVHHSI